MADAKYPSLSRKLLIAMLIPSIAALLLACATLLIYELRAYKRATSHNLTVLARAAAANCSALLVYDDQTVAQEILSTLKSEPDVVDACLYDRKRQLYSKYPPHTPSSEVPVVPGPDGARFSGMKLTVFEPVTQAGARLGTLYVRQDLRGMYRRFYAYTAVLVLVLSASVAVALLIARILRERISGPILSLAATARRISEQRDYSVRAEASASADELALLNRAFNDMLEQIHLRDISLQKAAEVLEQRVTERTQSLEETTRQLYDFCYSIAHDLKAPIRAQASYARLLLEDFGTHLGAEGSSYAERILGAAERQAGLVNDLLAHVSLSKSDLPIVPVELAIISAQALSDLAAEAERQQAIVDLSGVKGIVLANPASLHLIVINLLSNAIKFVPRGVAPEVKAWTETHNGFLRLTVRDNGIGIPARQLGKLFALFQRLHTREQYPGTGIGLAIVKRAAERMKGKVGVDSEEGKGSRFWVELPAADKSEHRIPNFKH
ncbi:MAG TPA: ATP-binding protein [Candidatus Limnocylindrales bacterium]|jgi:signal transduction histidine kinase|nr:ATP-binding protein [Candidatus Limnocylindrales bacterium]